MSAKLYQCRLVQGTKTTTAWIEERGARQYAFVELLPDGGTWMVAGVYSHGLPEEVVKETQRLNRRSLPSIKPIR